MYTSLWHIVVCRWLFGEASLLEVRLEIIASQEQQESFHH